MRLELTRVGLLVKLANRYTTKDARLKYLIQIMHLQIIYYMYKEDLALCKL